MIFLNNYNIYITANNHFLLFASPTNFHQFLIPQRTSPHVLTLIASAFACSDYCGEEIEPALQSSARNKSKKSQSSHKIYISLNVHFLPNILSTFSLPCCHGASARATVRRACTLPGFHGNSAVFSPQCRWNK